MYLQEILLWVFHSTFWAFSFIFQAPLSRSLWSGYHWKDLSILQMLSMDDAHFGQRKWCQKWNKGWGSSRPVTGDMGVNGLNSLVMSILTLPPSLKSINGRSSSYHLFFSSSLAWFDSCRSLLSLSFSSLSCFNDKDICNCAVYKNSVIHDKCQKLIHDCVGKHYLYFG